MQTAIAPRTTPGPVTPGASQPGSGSEPAVHDPAGRDDPVREDAGRDAFASFMNEAPPDKEVPADGGVPSPVTVESPLPAAFFWPTLTAASGPALNESATAALTPASGQPIPADLPAADGSAPHLPPSQALAGPGLVGQLGIVADQRLPAGVAIPSAMTAVAPQPADPGLALPDLPAVPVADGETPVTAHADLARPAAAMPGAAMAAAGLRFWQATPQPVPNAVPIADPEADPEALSALTSPPEADRPAAPNAPALAATAPPAILVAKLAETALQSLFAAQAEAAALEPDDAGGLGFTPTSHSTAPGAIASAAIPATTLPNLAAQLVQTLAQRPDGTTEIALSPDELGHVRVTLQADAQNPDRIIVMLNFERSETLDLFRRHADQLAEALRDAGFSGADIGFGRSEGGENRDARSDTPADMLASESSLTDLPTGPTPHHPALRLAASGTLDLRL